MIIERLAVKGFRSLADVVWEPGKLNVLIGLNGGGKTNLLKVVRLLKASADRKLGKFVQGEGGVMSMLWDGQATAIEIEYDGLFPYNDKRKYRLALEKEGPSYLVDRETLDAHGLPIERDRTGAFFRDDKERRGFTPKRGETILSFLESDWSSVAIYADADLNPSRGPTVVSLEETVTEDADNLIPVLHSLYTADRDFKAEIDSAMAAAFGSDFEELAFPPAADHRIQMRVHWKSLKRPQSSSDLSDGTLRFIFLATVLANPKKPPFIAIEEPETGLHPSMLPIIADLAAQAAEQSQIVLTTHSPALLDALGKHNPTITVVESQEGKTRLKNVTGEELEHWLREFTLGEVYSSGQLEKIS